MNIAAHNASNYVADAAGSKASLKAFARKMIALRRSAAGGAIGQETADAAAPLADIVQEEDQKERN